jgi:DNA (cytosine-5)-methyltransferase 1
LKILSLFSGAGGLDLGFKNAGFKIAWANEFDKKIWDTYEFNHSETKLIKKSITEITSDELPKDIEGIIGGPPCQSWSLAGSMGGINDKRGALFYDYIRILNHIKPKFFLVENVKGIISKAHINQFNHILDLFKEAGYNCEYKLLDASDFNVCQTRERVFIVGFRNDLNINFKFPKGNKKKIILREILSDIENEAKAFIKEGKQCPFNNEYMTGSFSTIFMSRNRRRSYGEQSFTIQASGRHAPVHPSSPEMIKIDKDKFIFNGKESDIRRLSVRECARIQTFPDNFKFIYKNIDDGYKMIGNAVPVKLAEAIAKEIKYSLDKILK